MATLVASTFDVNVSFAAGLKCADNVKLPANQTIPCSSSTLTTNHLVDLIFAQVQSPIITSKSQLSLHSPLEASRIKGALGEQQIDINCGMIKAADGSLIPSGSRLDSDGKTPAGCKIDPD
jgi:hypothetical protein